MQRDGTSVLRLGKPRFDEVVDTLSDAFHEYPFMRFVLSDAGADYERQLRLFVAYFTASRMSRGWPVLGVTDGGRLVAAANVTPPDPGPAPTTLRQRYARLTEEIGDEAIARLNAFAEVHETFEPDRPHYFVGMVGVRRRYQGRGHARRLMDTIHTMSADDPGSTGVLLSTESPENVEFYLRFGYRVRGKAKVEDLPTWVLFRPNPD